MNYFYEVVSSAIYRIKKVGLLAGEIEGVREGGTRERASEGERERERQGGRERELGREGGRERGKKEREGGGRAGEREREGGQVAPWIRRRCHVSSWVDLINFFKGWGRSHGFRRLG